MTSYVSAELRRLVASRARGLCEYCLIHESDTFVGCQVDHIISEKHGGLTIETNLAFACAFCNRYKGTDIGSVIQETGEFLRFYNPRVDCWANHFRLDGFRIEACSPIGEVTVRILALNALERVLEREQLARAGRYPPPEAVGLISSVK